MAAASSAGGNAIRAIRQEPPKYGSRLVAKCRATWYEIFRLVDNGPIGNKNIATELPTYWELAHGCKGCLLIRRRFPTNWDNSHPAHLVRTPNRTSSGAVVCPFRMDVQATLSLASPCYAQYLHRVPRPVCHLRSSGLGSGSANSRPLERPKGRAAI